MQIKSGLKLSALQMNSEIGNKQANIDKIQTIITRELQQGTDILVLPEVWTVGWDCETFSESAENIQSGTVIKFLSDIAQKYNTYVVGGSFIRKGDNGKLYNSCPVINRSGELIAIYDKNHLYSYCGCNEGSYITPGTNGVIVDIDGIKTGISICYDIRFPELFREYRKHGVDLIINVAAWGSSKPIPWEVLTKARAIENQVYFVALTQCGRINAEISNIGHSRIINYTGETLAEIKNQKEGILTTDISFKSLYEYRNICTILRDVKDRYEVKIYEKAADYTNITDRPISPSKNSKH